jgi:hypothetical protein
LNRCVTGQKRTCTMRGVFAGYEMTTETGRPGGLIWLALIALVILTGLCAGFALVVTAAQAWQEHAEARWPEATAYIDRCILEQISYGWRNKYHIHCRVTYLAGSRRNVANFYSRNVPSPNVSQYPPNQIAPYEEWVNAHPPGTPISVRYDPAKHGDAVLAADTMPGSGPHPASNVKLLAAFGGSFLVLLAIARFLWPRFRGRGDSASMPVNS